jgi:hypothetical protein
MMLPCVLWMDAFLAQLLQGLIYWIGYECARLVVFRGCQIQQKMGIVRRQEMVKVGHHRRRQNR